MAITINYRVVCQVILLGGGGSYWIGGEHHNHVERYDQTFFNTTRANLSNRYDQTGHLGSLPDMLQPR